MELNRNVLLLIALVAVFAAGGGGYVMATNRKRGTTWSRLLPEARAKVEELERKAAAAGLSVMFVAGWRDPAVTQKQIDQCNDNDPATPCVTKVKDSLSSGHAWGFAFDIAFKNAAGLPYWPKDTDPRWVQLARLGESIGLKSGGLAWGWDFPHFWLPGYSVSAVRAQYVTPQSFLSSRGVWA